MKETVSIIIPTYNEKDNITPLVERIYKALKGYNYEIVIVDDNSQDGTIDIVNSLSAKYPVKLLVRKTEKGLATAVIHGIRNCTGKYVCVMDADLQHPPEKLPEMIKAVENGVDMAFASRLVPGGGTAQWTFLRKLISSGAIKISHVLLPSSRQVKDITSGFFIFDKSKVNLDKLKPIGYKIGLEILTVGNFDNVTEVPFIFDDRAAGQSKLKMKTQIDYLKHIFSLMRRTGEIWRFLKFIGVGLSGVVVNEGILWLVRHFTNWNVLIQNIPGIEVSIITNFILNDVFTFADRRTGKTSSLFRRLGKYNTIALAGAVINWGIYTGMVHAGVNAYLSNFIGIVIAFIWNYFLSTVWAWR
jgi:dolichol-phosphate mannosyltransferase